MKNKPNAQKHAVMTFSFNISHCKQIIKSNSRNYRPLKLQEDKARLNKMWVHLTMIRMD